MSTNQVDGVELVPVPPVPTQRSGDWLLQPAHPFPLLLALANDDVADATIRITKALADTRGAIPSVIQVFDPSPYAPPPLLPSMISFTEALLGPGANEERRRVVTKQLERAVGHPVSWPVALRLGDPTTCIVNEVHKRSSELLVVGLHHHAKIERLFGAETTIHVVTGAGIPVLGVTGGPAGLTGLPRRVLVAVDFGQASMYMARLVGRLVEPPGELILAHVRCAEPPEIPEDAEGIALIHEEGVDAAFTQLMHHIAPAPGIAMRPVVLTGDPATALLAYAEQAHPDLVAVASQRHDRVSRLLLGSVSRHVIRDGRWSVFVTPPRMRAR